MLIGICSARDPLMIKGSEGVCKVNAVLHDVTTEIHMKCRVLRIHLPSSYRTLPETSYRASFPPFRISEKQDFLLRTCYKTL